jgi:hypothetical protein
MCANPVCISNNVAHTHDTAQCHYYSSKGKSGKGKGKGQRASIQGKGHQKGTEGLEHQPGTKGKSSKGIKGKTSPVKGFKGGKGVKG